MKTTATSILGTRLDRRLATYAAAGAAAAAASVVSGARADIVYSGPLTLAVPFNNRGIYLDLVTGQTSSSPFVGYDIEVFYSGSGEIDFIHDLNGGYVVPAGSNTSTTPASALAPGAFIGSTDTFGTGSLGTNFQVTGVEYLGVRFNNTATKQSNYGWIEFSTTAPGGNPATILGYAYNNTTGGSILAGQVPEPSATAMLGLGALSLGATGLRAWRRSRRTA